MPRPLKFGDDRAVRRMVDPAREEAPGLHHLVPDVVDRRRRMIDGADQRHLVHHRGQPGEDLGDLNARHLGRDRPERPADFLGRIGLHVPGVELRRAADQEQQDAIEVAIRRDGAGTRKGLHRRKAQAQCRQRAGMEEIPASQPVAEVHRLPGIDSEHRTTPLGSLRREWRARTIRACPSIHPNRFNCPGQTRSWIRWTRRLPIGLGLLDLVLLPTEFAASIFADVGLLDLSPANPGCKHAHGVKAGFVSIEFVLDGLPGLASFRRFPYSTGGGINREPARCKHHRTGMAGFVSIEFGLARIVEPDLISQWSAGIPAARQDWLRSANSPPHRGTRTIDFFVAIVASIARLRFRNRRGPNARRRVCVGSTAKPERSPQAPHTAWERGGQRIDLPII